MTANDESLALFVFGCCAALATLAVAELLLWARSVASARDEGAELVRALRALGPGGSIRLQVEGKEVEITVPEIQGGAK